MSDRTVYRIAKYVGDDTYEVKRKRYVGLHTVLNRMPEMGEMVLRQTEVRCRLQGHGTYDYQMRRNYRYVEERAPC